MYCADDQFCALRICGDGTERCVGARVICGHGTTPVGDFACEPYGDNLNFLTKIVDLHIMPRVSMVSKVFQEMKMNATVTKLLRILTFAMTVTIC